MTDEFHQSEYISPQDDKDILSRKLEFFAVKKFNHLDVILFDGRGVYGVKSEI